MSPTEQEIVNALADKGVKLRYGDDCELWVMLEDLEKAKQLVATVDAAELPSFTESIQRCLKVLIPIINSGASTERQRDDFYNDMMLWEALRQKVMQ